MDWSYLVVILCIVDVDRVHPLVLHWRTQVILSIQFEEVEASALRLGMELKVLTVLGLLVLL